MITRHLKLQEDGTYKNIMRPGDKIKISCEKAIKAFRAFGAAVRNINTQMTEEKNER